MSNHGRRTWIFSGPLCSSIPMTYRLLTLLSAVGLSCASAGEELQIGTSRQAIFMPDGYGIEAGDHTRCDTEWSGGRCYVPDNRGAKVYVNPAGCPNWYVQRMQNAVIDMNTLVQPYGWSIQLVGINDPWTYQIYCNMGTSVNPAAFSDHTGSMDCHDSSRGELCQTRAGYIEVRPLYAESKGVFQAASDFQRRMWMANILRHELGHLVLGFGHLPGTQQGTKLMAKGYPDDLQSDVWNSLLGPDADEQFMLDCYTPGSGRSNSC